MQRIQWHKYVNCIVYFLMLRHFWGVNLPGSFYLSTLVSMAVLTSPAVGYKKCEESCKPCQNSHKWKSSNIQYSVILFSVIISFRCEVYCFEGLTSSLQRWLVNTWESMVWSLSDHVFPRRLRRFLMVNQVYTRYSAIYFRY